MRILVHAALKQQVRDQSRTESLFAEDGCRATFHVLDAGHRLPMKRHDEPITQHEDHPTRIHQTETVRNVEMPVRVADFVDVTNQALWMLEDAREHRWIVEVSSDGQLETEPIE